MSDFHQVERDEIEVQFVRVPDGLEHIRRAWDELEAVCLCEDVTSTARSTP
jgi:hypothetical protein